MAKFEMKGQLFFERDTRDHRYLLDAGTKKTTTKKFCRRKLESISA